MCGRFVQFAEDEEIVSAFDLDLLEGETERPRYNLAPSQKARVVLECFVDIPDATGSTRKRLLRKGRFLQWGFVPRWTKTPSRPMINARAETLLGKPMFRASAVRRRCIVPANGYFEWHKHPKTNTKIPYFLSASPSDPLLAFAGIYEAWRNHQVPLGEEGAWLLTFAILTRGAPDELGRIHDRMPLILPPDMWDEWLDPTLEDPRCVHEMIGAVPDPLLRPRIVSPRVGKVDNDDPTLIAENPL